MEYIHNYFNDVLYIVEQHKNKKNLWYIKSASNLKMISVLKNVSVDEAQMHLLIKDNPHENIVAIKKVGKIRGDQRVFVEMEFVHGKTLGEWVDELKQTKNCFFSLEEALSVSMKICDGIQHLHELGFNHRDLSRNNVIFDFPNGTLNSLVLKIIDLGNCHFIKPDDENDTTALGTTNYVAPEQYGGKTDQTTDIFAIGKLICEMLTGNAQNFEKASENIENVYIKTIVKRCTRMDKDERYTTIYELHSELQKLYNSMCIEQKKSDNEGIVNRYFQWYDEQFKVDYKSILLEDSKPIPCQIYIVLVITITICFFCFYFINPGLVAVLLLFYPIYNIFLGCYFRVKYENMCFLYPYSQSFGVIKDKLIPALMTLKYDYEIVDDEHIRIFIEKGRSYNISIDIKKHTMSLKRDNPKNSIRDVFKMAEDYGQLVYIIQHINHF